MKVDKSSNSNYCSCCAHSCPDDIDHESLDIIFWCSCHNFETFGTSTCSDFTDDLGLPF